MKTNVFRSLALVLSMSVAQVWADTIPVLGYLAVPAQYTSVERYREMRNAGFTLSLTNLNSVTQAQEALDAAAKAGIRLMVSCDALKGNPSGVVPLLRNHPALYGYDLYDEPSMKDFTRLQNRVNAVRAKDSQHPCYINLLPDYDDGILSIIGVTDYSTYLRKFSQLKLEQISMDFYPVTTGGIRPRWYQTLEAIHRESVRTGKPFWGFVLSTPHAVYPMPTLSSLRLQVYVNLCYGAQAIQYFSYWTPKPRINDFHDGPISETGERTQTYTLVKRMNDELQYLAPVFLGCKVKDIGYLGWIPLGTHEFKKYPSGLRSLSVRGNKSGALVSYLTKGGRSYLCVVNKDVTDSLTVRCRFDKSVVRLSKTLREMPTDTVYHVSPGDLLLFRL